MLRPSLYNRGWRPIPAQSKVARPRPTPPVFRRSSAEECRERCSATAETRNVEILHRVDEHFRNSETRDEVRAQQRECGRRSRSSLSSNFGRRTIHPPPGDERTDSRSADQSQGRRPPELNYKPRHELRRNHRAGGGTAVEDSRCQRPLAHRKTIRRRLNTGLASWPLPPCLTESGRCPKSRRCEQKRARSLPRTTKLWTAHTPAECRIDPATVRRRRS
jgi:hypothetical protein